jgi:hypothetical protein
MKTQELKRDLLRQEFPDYFKVGNVYHLPRVPEGAWIEASWHNDAMPSWVLKTDEGLLIKLWIDYPNSEDREGGRVKRFSISLYTSKSELICDFSSTDDVGDLYKDLFHLVTLLNKP